MKSIRAQQKQHRSTPTRYHRTTPQMQYQTASTNQYRSTLPLLHRSTLGAYPRRRSSMCVEIVLMEKPPRDQISLGERRGGIGRRGKGPIEGSQLSFIPHFSDGVRKSTVRSRCFSQPFAKLQALLIAEMIDKGEESIEEPFAQE
ncbi:hypothetical protein YC2023_051118 [Brassica napus]